jgi:hypothetical protein
VGFAGVHVRHVLLRSRAGSRVRDAGGLGGTTWMFLLSAEELGYNLGFSCKFFLSSCASRRRHRATVRSPLELRLGPRLDGLHFAEREARFIDQTSARMEGVTL